jgi:hypothetical protein
LPAGHCARQAARRAQDGGASRCQFGPAPTSRLVSTDCQERMEMRLELIEALMEHDVEKVKVRRTLEAVSSTEYGPS